MIFLKNAKQIDKMKRAGRIAAELLKELEAMIRPGLETSELDLFSEEYIKSRGAKPGCKNYRGFPASICVSVDEEVVHGIPSKDKVLSEGQIVSIDFVVRLEGFSADMARTYAVGKIGPEKRRLMEVTEQSFFEAMKAVRPGAFMRDVSAAIEGHCRRNGYSVVRALTGHGIGKSMHEDPSVPNFVSGGGKGVRLEEGMTLAVEPMVCMGNYDVEFDAIDGWTVRTKDRMPAAHYENTIAVTQDGYEILTV